MARRKSYARTIAGLKPEKGKRSHLFDPETKGLCLRTSLAGAKAFYVVAKGPVDGKVKQRWVKLGDCAESDGSHGITLDAAREQAPAIVARIKAGQNSMEEPEEEKVFSFAKLAKQFMARHVTEKRRSADEFQRILDRYLLPALGERVVSLIRRRDINELLDQIEDGTLVGPDGRKYGGPVQADRVLAVIRKMFAWHSVRDDTFETPIVRGMNRVNPQERARTRILSDIEIRALWSVTESRGNFGGLVRFLLLSAQRLGKCQHLQWDDIDANGVWHVRPDGALAAREKGNPGTLPLSESALAVVRVQLQIKGNEHVFAGRGAAPYQGLSMAKKRLDKALLEELCRMASERGDDPEKVELEPWTLHDLRRSARSLMARAGVAPHIAEITLGHVQRGITQVYDRHDYQRERGHALGQLALIVEGIVNPTDSVIHMAGAGQ